MRRHDLVYSEVTITPSSNPMVSTKLCRFLSLIRLAVSKLGSFGHSVVFTL